MEIYHRWAFCMCNESIQIKHIRDSTYLQKNHIVFQPGLSLVDDTTLKLCGLKVRAELFVSYPVGLSMPKLPFHFFFFSLNFKLNSLKILSFDYGLLNFSVKVLLKSKFREFIVLKSIECFRSNWIDYKLRTEAQRLNRNH